MPYRRYAPIGTRKEVAAIAEVNDLTAVVTWANVPDVNITQSSVTQHEAALTILESQITDANVLARIAGNETISGQWSFDKGITTSAIITDAGQVGQFAFLDLAGGKGRVGSYNFDTASWQPFKFQGSDVEIEAVSGGNVTVIDGGTFRVQDATQADTIEIRHDGTDAHIDFVGTTNLDINLSSGSFRITGGNNLVILDTLTPLIGMLLGSRRLRHLALTS
jgi:hypothetical protein